MWWRDVGEEKHSIVLWLGLSLLVSLCLWIVYFTSVSQVLSPILCRRIWIEWAGLGISLLLGQLGSDNIPVG